MAKAAQNESGRLINRRRQGDLGEASAIDWFTRIGATVFLPFGHSPDIDLMIDLGGAAQRVQVKTSTQCLAPRRGEPRYSVTLATKRWEPELERPRQTHRPGSLRSALPLTAHGRRWCVPAAALDAGNALTLGGDKYSEYEIDPTDPIRSLVYEEESSLECRDALGEYPSGQRTATVNRLASPSEVRILSPPLGIKQATSFKATKYGRKPGQRGETRINAKRKVTLPQGPVIEAGLDVGDRLRARCAGYGRVILERIEPLTTPSTPEPEEAA